MNVQNNDCRKPNSHSIYFNSNEFYEGSYKKNKKNGRKKSKIEQLDKKLSLSETTEWIYSSNENSQTNTNILF